jgi:hypothetical protein
MRPSIRALVCACALTGASPLLYYVCSGECLGVLPEALDMPAAQRADREQQRLRQRGLAEREAVLAQEAAKRAVAEDLADGRVTLDEAAARVRALNAGDTEAMRRARLEATGARTEEEAARREAVVLLRVLSCRRPECAGMADRLEEELGPPLSRTGDVSPQPARHTSSH